MRCAAGGSLDGRACMWPAHLAGLSWMGGGSAESDSQQVLLTQAVTTG